MTDFKEIVFLAVADWIDYTILVSPVFGHSDQMYLSESLTCSCYYSVHVYISCCTHIHKSEAFLEKEQKTLNKNMVQKEEKQTAVQKGHLLGAWVAQSV